MALRYAFGSYARLQVGRRALGSCAGGEPPPCPPCAPPPRPPCRARPPERVRGVRVVCCPPPQGSPPPCGPPCRDPPLTCAQAAPERGRGARAATCTRGEQCGAGLDRVARRLEDAERERRRSYEKEAAERGPCRAPFPPAVAYSLGAERECCRATDGRDYAACESPPTGKCGPNRTPPPSKCVELRKDDACEVKGPRRVDPCAHKPRTIVQIDRSGRNETSTPASNPTPQPIPKACARPSSSPPAPSAPPRNFTARLMESLNLKRGASPSGSCPRRSCEGACDGSGARRAGDSSWCRTLKPPPAVPPPCRRPTRAELLARRPPSRCGPNQDPCPGPRRLHSAACLTAKSKTPAASPESMRADAAKLEKALEERRSFAEAGRGRVVVEDPTSEANRPAASLDICVPPGAEKLSVRVQLDGGGCRKKPKCEKPPECPAKKSEPSECSTPATPPDSAVARCSAANIDTHNRRDSWLSIKSLLSSCRREGAPPSTCPPTEKKPPPPCGASKSSSPPCDPCKPPVPPTACKPQTPPAPCKSPAPPSPCKTPATPSPCKTPTPPSPCITPTPPSPCKKPLISPKPSQHNPPKQPTSPCKPPAKPDQKPCSSGKTKFTAESDLLLKTFLLKW